jgi:hypothetical protein
MRVVGVEPGAQARDHAPRPRIRPADHRGRGAAAPIDPQDVVPERVEAYPLNGLRVPPDLLHDPVDALERAFDEQLRIGVEATVGRRRQRVFDLVRELPNGPAPGVIDQRTGGRRAHVDGENEGKRRLLELDRAGPIHAAHSRLSRGTPGNHLLHAICMSQYRFSGPGKQAAEMETP